jgi:hypothetical protein
MTTQRDLDTAAEVSLKICPACGWYDTLGHAEHCDPERGRAATQLIEAVPDVRAGKLGYGDRQLVFDLAEDFTVRFEVRHVSPVSLEHRFSLEDIHFLERLSGDEAASLVRALQRWRDEISARRSSDPSAADR